MTKKVLISWEQLKNLMMDFIEIIDKEDVVTLRPALDWFDSQPKAAEWVSVEDRLPEDMQSVLILICDSPIIIMSATYEYEGNLFFSADNKYYSPTHWMPIPPLSKMETTGGKDDNTRRRIEDKIIANKEEPREEVTVDELIDTIKEIMVGNTDWIRRFEISCQRDDNLRDQLNEKFRNIKEKLTYLVSLQEKYRKASN
jgi:hypothetical protein